MTEQHQAAPELWAAAEKWGANTMDMANCLLELRDRVEALEAAQQPQQDKLDRLIALDRDDSTEAATQQPPQFTAKYLFTPSNILFDSFCYDPSDSNSVWFGAIITDLLAPGDNIKIAHRWGEMPSSEVHSTIDYKIVSISENPDYDKRVCTVYATRVDASDSASAAAPAGSLVEWVADAIGAADDEGLTNMTWSNHSRAAILEVAEWLRAEMIDQGVLTYGLDWATRLEQEANR